MLGAPTGRQPFLPVCSDSVDRGFRLIVRLVDRTLRWRRIGFVRLVVVELVGRSIVCVGPDLLRVRSLRVGRLGVCGLDTDRIFVSAAFLGGHCPDSLCVGSGTVADSL